MVRGSGEESVNDTQSLTRAASPLLTSRPCLPGKLYLILGSHFFIPLDDRETGIIKRKKPIVITTSSLTTCSLLA